MMKIILIILLSFHFTFTWGHEQWLLSAQEIEMLSAIPKPILFTKATVFNVIFLSFASLGIILWVYIHNKYFKYSKINKYQIDWALFSIRFGTGAMLILCALGLLPQTGIPFFKEPTLLAPDLLIHKLSLFWLPIKWVEIILGLWLVFGMFTRYAALALLGLIITALYLYHFLMFHYIGFYLGASIFLIINGGGKWVIGPPEMINFQPISLFLMQALTGMNFIYSSIRIKWTIPNVDIFLLEKTQAFTFGIPYEKFAFIMFIIEFAFGVLFIIGYQLRLISLILLSLFIFLSINFTENLFAHSFIYGILAVFIILQGYPLRLKRIFIFFKNLLKTAFT